MAETKASVTGRTGDEDEGGKTKPRAHVGAKEALSLLPFASHLILSLPSFVGVQRDGIIIK